jgi:hypothetical protein
MIRGVGCGLIISFTILSLPHPPPLIPPNGGEEDSEAWGGSCKAYNTPAGLVPLPLSLLLVVLFSQQVVVGENYWIISGSLK